MPQVDDEIDGRYLLVEKMGQGGMGVVFRARLLDEPSRQVAIKLIRPEFADDPARRRRFVRESRALLRIKHANVLPIERTGQLPDGSVYIAMQLVPEGHNVEDFAEGNRPLDWRTSGQLMLQATRGVEAVHAAKMLHRDIKPTNMLIAHLATGLRIYVADFGLVKMVKIAEDSSTVSLTGGFGGSRGFSAPEQFDPRWGKVGTESDVYALGRTYLYLLTTAVGSDFIALNAGDAELPKQVRPIVSKATQDRPADRYKDATAFRIALESALRDVPATPPLRPPSRSDFTTRQPRYPRDDPRRVPNRKSKPSKDGSGARLAIAAAGVLVAMGAGFAVAGQDGAPPPQDKNRTVGNGRLHIQQAPGWSRITSQDTSALPLTRRTSLAGPGPSPTTIVMGDMASAHPGLDPLRLTTTADLVDPPKPRRLRIGDLETIAYRARTREGDRVSYYAVPTTSGYGAVVCRTPAAASATDNQECDDMAARVTVAPGQSAETVGADKRYATAVAEVLNSAQASRRRASSALAGRSLSDRASAAARLARVYRRAARSLADAGSHMQDREARRDLVGALNALHQGFDLLASSSRSKKSKAYERARNKVTAADRGIDRALAGLERAGYRVKRQELASKPGS